MGLTSEEIFGAFFEGFTQVLGILFNVSIETIFSSPILLWILLPAFVAGLLFRSKEGYSIGFALGLLGLVTVGPGF